MTFLARIHAQRLKLLDLIRKVLWRGSPLNRMIIGLNLMGLVILIIGALIINDRQQVLVDGNQKSLTAQAALLGEVIAEGATRGDPEPHLEPIAVSVLSRFVPRGQRVRLYDKAGDLLADSYVVSEDVTIADLEPALKVKKPAKSYEENEAKARQIAKAKTQIDAEIRKALQGERVASIRDTEDGKRVISVTIPVQRVSVILGALNLETGNVNEILSEQRKGLLPFIAISLLTTVLSMLFMNRVVTEPIHRLAAAADQVRLQKARALSLPDLEARKDEVGDLTRSLETMTATLSQRMDAIDRFAADVSHEIKNPLTSIRSALETLDLVKDETAKTRLMNVLKQDVRRMDRLITDISNASRLDAELSRSRERVVSLSELMTDICQSYENGARGPKIPVHLRVAADLNPAMIRGLDGPLGQVFRNLIDNARSFSPEDGTVEIHLERDQNDTVRPLIVRVEDNGPGIPPENLETVFQRFYTSRPKGTAFGGNSGLGLSIARQIIESHGGQIWAENRLSAQGSILGARFTVALPEA